MPTCFVPGCRSGYRSIKGKHFFTPPKDEKHFSLWVNAIPRKDIPLTHKSSICDSHFSDELLIKVDSFLIEDKKVDIPRLKWRLKPGAVPHVFPNLPSYLSKPLKNRKPPLNRELPIPVCEESSIDIGKHVEVDNNISDLPSTTKETNKYADSANVILNLKRNIKNLNRNLSRTKNKLTIYKAKLQLIETKLAQNDARKTKDVLNCLDKKQKLIVDTMLKKCNTCTKGMRYSNEFILDSLLLKIKSPKGYRHCLKHNLLPLPTESHLRRLCKGLKCKYGVNKNALSAIKQTFFNEPDENKKLGIVIFDEVKLREEVRFDPNTMKVDGFVDLGKETPDDRKNVLANHALVFMFVPFLYNWVQPVAVYASKNSTPGDILSKIIIEVILQLEQAGVKVIGFTCDGSQSNKKAWLNLGISGNNNRPNITCSIPNPVDGQRRVWAFSDSVHILKCIRNYFHDNVQLLYKNKKVQYNFYRKILELDTSPEFAGLRSCHKLTSSHIDPSSFQKMNARLAFQLFSNNVADGIKFFREMKPNEFCDSEHTELFTRDLNCLADALNSTLPVKGLYKGSSSHKILVSFLENITSQTNTFASVRTLESLRVTLKSTLEMAEYMWSRGFKYVLTAKCNQDPLERHFGILRSVSCDDHPSTIDFLHLHMLQSVYVPTKLALSSTANCEPKVESPLTSFVNQIRIMAKEVERENKKTTESVEAKIKEKLVIDDWESKITVPYEKNLTKQNLVFHLAGYIVKKSDKYVNCLECARTLRNEQCSDISAATFTTIKDYGSEIGTSYLTYPSCHVLRLFLQVESVVSNKLSTENNLWGDIFFECLDSIDSIVIGPRDLGCTIDHRNDLLGKLISHYIKCRFFFRIKEIRKELLSSKLAKSSRKLAKVSEC